MPPRRKIGTTEKDLAAAVVAWLNQKGYAQVYQEVVFGGGTADLVVDRDGNGWVIETKKSLSLAVMGQAYDRQNDTGLVSIAVFKAKKRDSGRNFARTLCRQFGMGLLEVDAYGYVHEVATPTDMKRSKRIGDILQSCRPEHLTFCAAGSQNGAFTVFKDTIIKVRKFLREYGPRTVKQIVENVDHHYKTASTARRSLEKWLQQSKVCPGIDHEKIEGVIYYSLKEGYDVHGKSTGSR